MRDQDFRDFLKFHWPRLAADLDLSNEIVLDLHVAGVLTDHEHAFLLGTLDVYARGLTFCNILQNNPAGMKSKVDTMITVFQNHQRVGVVQVLQEFNHWPGQPVARIQPFMVQPVPFLAQEMQPNQGASATAEAGCFISYDIWCDFLDENSEILRQTLKLDNSIVATLKSTKFLGAIEVEKIKKFSEAEKDARAIAFLGLIKDKVHKIDVLVAAFTNDRHIRSTPALLVSEFLASQRQQVPQIQPSQVGHTSGLLDQRLWLALLRNNRDDLLKKLEIRNKQLSALANLGCIDRNEFFEINLHPEVVMEQRVHAFLGILARRQPPNWQMLTNMIEALNDPLSPAAANIFKNIRGSMFPQV